MRARQFGLTSSLATACLLVYAACASSDEAVQEPLSKIVAKPVVDFPDSPVEKVVDAIFVQATLEHPTPEERATWSERLRANGSDLQRLIDELMRDPRFTSKVGPKLLVADMAFHATRYLQLHGWVLKKFKTSDGREVYYTKNQCQSDEIETVRPWWSPGETIDVCRKAHQPDNFFNPKTKVYCGAAPTTPTIAADDFCGCGPNLMRCYPTLEHRNAFQKSIVGEAEKTLQYIVEHDLPLSDVFTTKYSFRDRNVEMIYRTWVVEFKHLDELPGLDDLQAWPEKGKWAERQEVAKGQHAGLLSTPNVAFNSSGLRAVMRNNFEHLWCVTPKSSDVDIHDILQLGENLRNARAGQGWEKLARRPICTDCHARLDYGMQFFKGFFDVRVGVHYDPTNQHDGKMQVYADDIEDPRGEAPATPEGFAGVAVRQREYARCSAERINKVLYGEETTLEDTSALLNGFDPFKTTARELMRTALLRFGERMLRGHGLRPEERALQVSTVARSAPPAEEIPDLRNVSIVVADAFGNKAWGPKQVANGARRALADGVGKLIPTEELTRAQAKLRHTSKQKHDAVKLAEAGRSIGAEYVLRVVLRKTGWKYTAHAVLIHTASAEEQMDFRAQYFKPSEEAEDRGTRIGAKTVWKLGVLRTNKPDVLLTSAEAGAAISTVGADLNASPLAGGEIALPSRATEIIDDVCTECHNDGEVAGGLDFEKYVTSRRIPRALAFKVLNDVSSFEMPPTLPGLDPWDRRALLSELVSEVWKDDAEKKSLAYSYFVERNRAGPVYPIPVAINTILGVTGSAPEERSLIESGVSPDTLQYSPGFIAGVALLALDACKKAGHQDKALDDCLRKATAPSLYLKPDVDGGEQPEEKRPGVLVYAGDETK